MAQYDKKEVLERVEGKWIYVYSSLAPQLHTALSRIGRHVPCPKNNAGKTRFRLLPAVNETGAGFSNDGGVGIRGYISSGVDMLMWLNGWTFSETINKIGEALGLTPIHEKNQSGQSSTKVINTENVVMHANAARFFGVLVEHGKARYEFKEDNDLSYYAKLKYASGFERHVWGVDIERALVDAGCEVGQEVTLFNLGRQPVVLMVEQRDSAGQVIGTSELHTHRNLWKAEQKSHANTQKPVIDVPAAEVKQSNMSAQPMRAQGVKADQFSHDAADKAVKVIPVAAVVNKASAPVDVPQNLRSPAVDLIVQRAEEYMKASAKAKVEAAAKIERIWNETVPFPHELSFPMTQYLQNRSILCQGMRDAPDMRFHPALKYYDGDGNLKGTFPAIVCAIRDPKGQIVTLHRTYITKKGMKAAVGEAKKMMTVPDGMTVTGGAIRLGTPTDGILGLAEGLETAWSPARALKITTWCAVNANGLENFVVPDDVDVHTIIIWEDKDRSLRGEQASQVAKAKLEAEGYNVFIMKPSSPIPPRAKGVDWNDVLVNQGILGFPSRSSVLRATAAKMTSSI